jgi:hypothetical protein
MPSGGPATGRNASANGNKSCFQTVRDRDKFPDVMATGCSSILAAAERQQPSRFVHARATSPLKTRVQGFRQSPPGRLSRRARRRPINTPGSRACAYKTASGRFKWLNRDPMGEPGFESIRRGALVSLSYAPNPYTFVSNQPTDRWDAFGLYETTPCNLFNDCKKKYDNCLKRGLVFCTLVGLAQPELFIPCMVAYGAVCTADFDKCRRGL